MTSVAGETEDNVFREVRETRRRRRVWFLTAYFTVGGEGSQRLMSVNPKDSSTQPSLTNYASITLHQEKTNYSFFEDALHRKISAKILLQVVCSNNKVMFCSLSQSKNRIPHLVARHIWRQNVKKSLIMTKISNTFKTHHVLFKKRLHLSHPCLSPARQHEPSNANFNFLSTKFQKEDIW